MRRILLIFLSLSLITISVSHGQEGIVAIRAGEILTISGAPVINGVILIEDGKIVAVGKDPAIPDGASVIDASNSVVMPGLVDANAISIIRGDDNEQSEEITPSFRVSRAISPGKRSD